MKERRGRLWVDAAVAGATAGILAEVMVLRLNPEVIPAAGSILIGAFMWATWGALGFGLPFLMVAALVRRILGQRGGWSLPELVAVSYLLASVMSKVNADLHEFLLSPSAQLVMRQDAVAWGGGVLVALLGGALVRGRGSAVRLRYLFAVVLMALPLVRFLLVDTPPGFPLEVETRPIGTPERRLVVVGVEGLDGGVLLGLADDGEFENLVNLRRSGSWGVLTPHRPYLRRSGWTSVATGTYPDRHGVKSHWGWLLPWLPDRPLRLLPWTPRGSRLILPWGSADRVTPPPASVPPLWERIRASGASTAVIEWPGIWASSVAMTPPAEVSASALDPDFRSSLQWALEPFPERGEIVWRALVGDLGRVAVAMEALEGGADQVWLHLFSLAEARRELEPLTSRHTREREVMALVLRLVDRHLGQVMRAAGPDATVAVVSPYGFAPPDPWERLARLLGIGDEWRTSAETCPNGLLMVRGPGVSGGERLGAARLPDVVPTLCYLLGLPSAQYMEGQLIVDAIEPEYLEDHPFRVVD